MSKQDRQGARTVSELERKYGLRNFGESFAEVMGLVTDARQATDDLEVRLDGEVERIDKEIETVKETIIEVEERIVLSVSGDYATKSELELTSDAIKAFVAGEYETKGDADSAYFLLQSQISVEKDAILLSVSTIYETKDDALTAYGNLESKISVERDAIMLSVSKDYETKTDAGAAYDDLESKIQVSSDNILLSVSGAYETKEDSKARYDEIGETLEESYAKKEFVNSQIAVEKDAILLSVSSEYETKNSAQTEYGKLEAAISASSDSILLSVSEDYETKSDAQTEYASLASQIQASSDSILLSVSLSYASKDEVSGFATKDDLSGFATYDDLSGFASEGYIDAQLELKVGIDDNDQIVSMLNASASVINITSNRLVIDSDNFSLAADGTVECDGITARNGDFSGTFTNSNGLGTLEINGAELTATQSASSARLWSGNLWLENNTYSAQYGADGFTAGDFRCNTSNSGGSTNSAYVGFGDGYIVFSSDSANLSGTWTSDSSISVTSDADKKHDIADVTDAYSVIFDNLKPRLYKYNDGKSNRIHVGFVAQEVEEAILAAGLTTQDFAAFVRAEVPNVETGETETVCMLRYEEFIALNTLEIQKLKAKEN